MDRELAYLERPVYSYAFDCFPSLWRRDIKRKTLPVKGISLEEILNEIKKYDSAGRQKVLGIYQSFITKNRAEIMRYKDENYRGDFFANKFELVEYIHPELICAVYDVESHKDRPALTEKQEEASQSVVGAITKVIEKVIEMSDPKIREKYLSFKKESKRELSREEMHELSLFYIRNDDLLGRLAIYPTDRIPNFYDKDCTLVPYYFEKINREVTSGKVTSDCNRIREIADFLEKAKEVREKYGLTRTETIQFEIIKLHLAELNREAEKLN